MKAQITLGDAVKWAQEYEGELFHGLFCDSPYHLTTIVKRFGKKNAAPAKHGKDGAFARASKGFMGQEWDGGDVAFRPETWAAYMRVLHPGAFGMTFAGSRGWHRLAVAIEDAGFIIHPTIFGWAYGSGFPKATRVKEDPEKIFEGHRYGLQALKPALEPIIVFQKPYEGRPIDNIKDTGAGVLNIDAARIPTKDEYSINTFDDGAKPFGHGAGHKYSSKKVKPLSNHSRSADAAKSKGIYGDSKEQETHQTEGQLIGRWPANFLLMDEGAAQALDRQSGFLTSGQPSGIRKADNNIYGKFKTGTLITGVGDSGYASRFFFQAQQDQLDSADPVKYAAKANMDERSAGLKDLPLLEQSHNRFDTCAKCGGTIFQNKNRPSACKCEIPERQPAKLVNPHPTVKPLSLTRYLASLLLPPAEYSPRRLFVPFAGVGSEVIGGMQAGWDEVTGVEITKEYIPIANARLRYWGDRGWQADLFTMDKS